MEVLDLFNTLSEEKQKEIIKLMQLSLAQEKYSKFPGEITLADCQQTTIQDSRVELQVSNAKFSHLTVVQNGTSQIIILRPIDFDVLRRIFKKVEEKLGQPKETQTEKPVQSKSLYPFEAPLPDDEEIIYVTPPIREKDSSPQ